MYPAFFKEIVALDKRLDSGVKVLPVENYGFVSNESVMPALIDELPVLARDYPVVFTSHETPVMIAVLGHGRNAFVDEQANWQPGKYIPFAVRTYPFAGLADNTGNIIFCLDRKYPGVGDAGGHEIFADSEGTFTEFGQNAANFANIYATSLKNTYQFGQRLKELGLLISADITVTKNGQKFDFTGLQQVDFTRLSSISYKNLKELINSQGLYYIYLHQLSLNNFSNIV